MVEKSPNLVCFTGFRSQFPEWFVIIPCFGEEQDDDLLRKDFIIDLEEVEAANTGEFPCRGPPKGFKPCF